MEKLNRQSQLTKAGSGKVVPVKELVPIFHTPHPPKEPKPDRDTSIGARRLSASASTSDVQPGNRQMSIDEKESPDTPDLDQANVSNNEDHHSHSVQCLRQTHRDSSLGEFRRWFLDQKILEGDEPPSGGEKKQQPAEHTRLGVSRQRTDSTVISEETASGLERVGQGRHAPRTPSLSAVKELEEIQEESDECEDLDTLPELPCLSGQSNFRANETESRSGWNGQTLRSIQGGNNTHGSPQDSPEWINATNQSHSVDQPQRWVMKNDTHRMAMRWSPRQPPLPPSPLVRDIKMPDLENEKDQPDGRAQCESLVGSNPRRNRYEESLPVSMAQNSDSYRLLSGHRNPPEMLPFSRTSNSSPQDQHSAGRLPHKGVDENPRSVRGSSAFSAFRQPPSVPRLGLSHWVSGQERRPVWGSQGGREESDSEDKWGVYHKAVGKCTEILDQDDDSRLHRFVAHKRLAENILGDSGMNPRLWREDLEEEEEEEEEDEYVIMETTL